MYEYMAWLSKGGVYVVFKRKKLWVTGSFNSWLPKTCTTAMNILKQSLLLAHFRLNSILGICYVVTFLERAGTNVSENPDYFGSNLNLTCEIILILTSGDRNVEGSSGTQQGHRTCVIRNTLRARHLWSDFLSLRAPMLRYLGMYKKQSFGCFILQFRNNHN